MFPFARIKRNCLRNASKSGRQLLVELDDVVPGVLGDPVLTWWLGQGALVVTHGDSAAQEESKFVRIDEPVGHLQFDAKVESKEQLVAFEERLARLSVDVQDVNLDNVVDLVLLLRGLILGRPN